METAAWGILLLLVALVFDPFVQIQFTLPKLVALRAIMPVVVMLWIARFRRGDVRPVPRIVLIALAALAAWWTLTTFAAVDIPTALDGMHGRFNGLINQLILVAWFLAIASSAGSRKQVYALLVFVILALVPVALYVFAQSQGLDPLTWPNPRPASTIGHPVPLAAMLALAVPFVIAFLVNARSLAMRMLWSLVLLLFLLASLATLSRGPWAGLAVAILIVGAAVAIDLPFWRVNRRIRAAVIVTACAGVIAAAALSWTTLSVQRVVTRLTALSRLETDPSFMNRFVYAGAGFRMLRDHPIAGIGFESYGLLYPRYRPVEREMVPSDELPTMVHNGYLQMAVTHGVPAAALYVVFVLSTVVLLWRSARQTAPDRIVAVAFIASIAGYLVQDLSGWEEIPLSVFFWTVLGAAVAFSGLDREVGVPRPPRGLRRTTVTITGTVLAAGLLLLAWQSVRLLRADAWMFEARALDVARDWPRVEADAANALFLAPGSAYYEDAAGVLYLTRVRASGDAVAYTRAALLLDDAARRNGFDPYVLIHRVDLETAALEMKVGETAPAAAATAAASLLRMDPNNATAHEAVARWQLAEGRPRDALVSIRRAETLRPNHPRYHMLEGDALRTFGDKHGAIDAYRQEAALQAGPAGAGWIAAENKAILALVETGEYESAIAEAGRVLERAPSESVTQALLGFAYLGIDARDTDHRARNAFARALQIDPSNAAAQQGLRAIH